MADFLNKDIFTLSGLHVTVLVVLAVVVAWALFFKGK